MPEGARLVAGHQTWARHLVLALILAIWLTIALVPQPVTGAQGDPPPSHAHGILTLADAQVTGSAIDVTYGDSFSFSVPLDAGYVISERNDIRGVRHLYLASYNQLGLDFEIAVDLFLLDAPGMSPLDLVARDILSAGRAVRVVRSESLELAGLMGLDLFLTGVSHDRLMLAGGMRLVFLTDFHQGVSFITLGYQSHPENHQAALDKILSTLALGPGWKTPH